MCRDWEAATGPAARGGARVVLLRSAPVLSPAGGLLGRLRPLFRCMLGGRLGPGTQYLPWISLDDEVGAIRFLLEHGTDRGPVNLAGPELVDQRASSPGRWPRRSTGRRRSWCPEFALKAVLGQMARGDGAHRAARAVPGRATGDDLRLARRPVTTLWPAHSGYYAAARPSAFCISSRRIASCIRVRRGTA